MEVLSVKRKKKAFTGMIVRIMQIDKETIYAVSEEHIKSKVIDCAFYDITAMTEQEIRELITVGGVFTNCPTPKIHLDWLKENGKEVAFSMISDEGVELESCNTDIPKIKNAFNR